MIGGTLLLGLLLIVTALKGTQAKLAEQLQIDLLGQDGFIAWIAAILALGGLGYIPGMATISRNLMALLIVVIVLRNGGVFANFETALQAASATGPAPAVPVPDVAGGGSSGSSGSSGGSAVNAVGGILSGAAGIAKAVPWIGALF